MLAVSFVGTISKGYQGAPAVRESTAKFGKFLNFKVQVRNAAKTGDKRQSRFLPVEYAVSDKSKLKEYLTEGQDVFVVGTMEEETYIPKDGGNARTFWRVRADEVQLVGGRREKEVSEPAAAKDDCPF